MVSSKIPPIQGKSICRGTIEEVLKIYNNSSHPLTIFSRSSDRSRERNEVPYYRFRKIFFTDDTEVLQGNRSSEARCVRLTAFIAKQDEDHPNPYIFVEQSVRRAGRERIMIYELQFGGKVIPDREYIFPDCGDEDPHRYPGQRDLLLSVRSLQQDIFDDYIRRATYYGYDWKDWAWVNQHALKHGLEYELSRPKILGESTVKVSFDPADLQALVDAKRAMHLATGGQASDKIELLKLRFKGLGSCTEDGIQSGDLDLRIVYKPY
ncbi:hypothetical protein P170DRAFT_409317 [Aspergillus steynii IBT 23096]|uniref:Uncharacterized protein n=1 Tax=Aspergillus steynii IBT 23096 TaxID=1392250 RepID=A0A2I2GA36_9EURO|nr:uncharacterized protein P170DRAFT_409317 [Aspergillus steynii IBT 23096]PLB49741.1 hypothetical protein P170DRAFT_409317 [Aspergillus steynii IBT 23096]